MSSQEQTADVTESSGEFEILPEHRGDESRIWRILRNQLQIFRGERLGQIGVAILLSFLLIGLFAPYIAPYDAEIGRAHV